jgi:hypothetical protein
MTQAAPINHADTKAHSRTKLDGASGWSLLSRADGALAFLLFAASLALYARTMAPGLLAGDEGEFQTNIYRLGVSHTGYPLFFMLGKLFTLLVPVGTVATRANLYSAVWGALTIAATYVFFQFLTRNRWVAVIAALLLTASRVEWSQAIIPRPYTLNSLFVILIPLFFFLWRIGKVDLTVPVFVFGLSLTNHRTIMWFGPAIAVFVLIADYQMTFADQKPVGNFAATVREWLSRSALFKPRRVLALSAAFVLPLLLYGYIWWRGESDVGVEFHWKDFNAEILGGYVSASWRFGPPDWLVSRVTDLYIPMLIEQFTALGFVAGLIGMVALTLDRVPRGWNRALPPREVFLFILLANLANSAFCVIFWVIDIDKFFLPSFITFLFFTGVGIAVVWDWLTTPLPRVLPMVAQGATALAFVGAAGFLLRQNYATDDFSHRDEAITTWRENLAQPLEQHAVIVGPWETLTPLEYAMYVDGTRTDLERWKVIVQQSQLGLVPYGSRQADIERAVRAGRPVYLTVYPGDTETLTGLLDEFRFVQIGELWRAINLPPKATPPQGTPITTFTDAEGRAIELLGYTVYPSDTSHPGEFALVTLFWRAPHAPGTRYTISFRLVNAQGGKIVQRDSEPANGLRPTLGWTDNEIVQDDVGLLVPPDLSPGTYRLQIVVYDSATVKNLTTPSGVLFTLGDLKVTPR